MGHIAPNSFGGFVRLVPRRLDACLVCPDTPKRYGHQLFVRIEVNHGPDELLWVVVDPLVSLALHRDDRGAGVRAATAAVAARKYAGLLVPSSIRTGTVMLASRSVAW